MNSVGIALNRWLYAGNLACSWSPVIVNINRYASEGSYEHNRVSKEVRLSETLKRHLPGATYVSITDISGGCGDMFEINIEAHEFRGLSRVKQHQLVTNSLKVEISEMHGIRIHTAVPALSTGTSATSATSASQDTHSHPPKPPSHSH